MTKVLSIAGLFFVLYGFLAGCKSEATTATEYLNQADCTGVDAINNTYTKSIKAILNDNCANSGCHTANSLAGGIDLSTYTTAKNGIQNLECLCSLHHGSGCKPMPEGGGKLDDATIQLIDCWAKNGYTE